MISQLAGYPPKRALWEFGTLVIPSNVGIQEYYTEF